MPSVKRNKPTISRSLELPDGYQHWDWCQDETHGLRLNNVAELKKTVMYNPTDEVYVYTQHEIFFEDGVFKQTRSSPNWEGGMLTYATCKHLMRCYTKNTWVGTWIMGLCPKHCQNNAVLFLGQVWKEFPSNYTLSQAIKQSYPKIFDAKSALLNPRGDLYTPKRRLVTPEEVYDHRNYIPPENHTRSLEYYKKSPGSVSKRSDGKIPKWWRDIEYQTRSNNRPKTFILDPCFVFSKPLVHSGIKPGRACIRTTLSELSLT